ncbi:MAG: Gfo/Idh/MocA family protein, partial [Anaerolineales bacterium]
QRLRAVLAGVSGPKQIVCRVNGGPLPPDHWLRDPEVGGGRIVGEGCHFFDLLAWLVDSEPVSIAAQAAGDSPDDLAAVVRFADGSVGTLVYSGLGDPAFPKERIEVMAGGGVGVIDDFQSLVLSGLPGKSARLRAQDKGQRALLEHFLMAVQGQVELAVTARDGLRATQCARAALQSVVEGRAITVG